MNRKKHICYMLILIMIFSVFSPTAYANFGMEPDDFVVEDFGGGIRITDYNGIETDVIIPDVIDGKTVIAIGNGAFSGKQLTSIVIPDSVTSIEAWAFTGNQITNIIIGNGVTNIYRGAFAENKLTSITFPSNVISIGDSVLAENQLTSITINSADVNIEDGLLDYSNSNNSFKDSYLVGGTGTYAGSQTGEWVKLGEDDKIVNIPDKNLETSIRNAIFKHSGSIFKSDIESITGALDLTNKNIQNISGLEYATNIFALYLNSNSISDLSPLENLVDLISLDLGNNVISDLSPLTNLTKLSYLNLSRNNLTNISPLSGLENLNTLYLDNSPYEAIESDGIYQYTYFHSDSLGRTDNINTISDVSPLATLSKLETLDLSAALDTIDLSSLNTLINLRDLKINLLFLEDISWLENMNNLESIEMYRNNISDISSLANKTQLIAIHGYNNNISDLSPLADSTNLIGLHLNNNAISDLSPLANLPNLIGLTLDDNMISDLSSLQNITSLQTLRLGNNLITDISPLVNLINLRLLNLSNSSIDALPEPIPVGGNNIIDISFLSGMTDLETLYLSNNKVRDISSLSNLTNLKVLWLSNNKIRDISALKNHTFLQSLILSNNEISDMSIVPTLSNVSTLWLNKNFIGPYGNNLAHHLLSFQDRSDQFKLFVKDINNDTFIDTTLVGTVGDFIDIRFFRGHVALPDWKEEFSASYYEDIVVTTSDPTIVRLDEETINVNGEVVTNKTKIVPLEPGTATISVYLYGGAVGYAYYSFYVIVPDPNSLGTITVKYLDENSNSIAPDEVYSNLPMGEHSFNAKTIEGYTLNDSNSKTAFLTFDGESRVVIFNYTKIPELKGMIRVVYLDENYNPIAPDDFHTDLPMGEHSFNAKDIPGYIVNGLNTKKATLSHNGQYIYVEFFYTKALGSITGTVTNSLNGNIIEEVNVIASFDESTSTMWGGFHLNKAGKNINRISLDIDPPNTNVTKFMGMIRDSNTFMGIPGITIITSKNRTVTTDEFGNFAIEIDSDEYNNIIIDKSSYIENSISINGAFADDMFNFIDNININATHSMNTTTGTNGEYLFDKLDTRTYSLKFSKSGFNDGFESATILHDNMNIIVDKSLDPIVGTITVRYLDEEGNPISEDDVFNNLAMGEHTYTARDINGYTLDDSNTKSATLVNDGQVIVIEFSYKENTVPSIPNEPDPTPNPTPDPEPIIEPKKIGVIKGQVRESTGAPIKGAKVLTIGSNLEPLTTETDENGFYEFKELAFGEYIMVLRTEDTFIIRMIVVQ